MRGVFFQELGWLACCWWLSRAAVAAGEVDTPRVYIFGLQRSGTNAVAIFLSTSFNINGTRLKLQNQAKTRDSPRHKHFRIYDDKRVVPPAIQSQFGNTIRVDNMTAFAEILGEDVRYIRCVVVVKNVFAWLESIERWSERVKWDPKFQLEHFLADYSAYVTKWLQLQATAPHAVLLVTYEEFLQATVRQDPSFVARLLDFFGRDSAAPLRPAPQTIAKVPSSSARDTDFAAAYQDQDFYHNFTAQQRALIEAQTAHLRRLAWPQASR